MTPECRQLYQEKLPETDKARSVHMQVRNDCGNKNDLGMRAAYPEEKGGRQ